MVTGFSTVIYSRLNIIVQSRYIRRLVLAMIIVTSICLHSIIVLQFGLTTTTLHDPENRGPWLAGINPMERIQVTCFSIQELIISSFYVKAAWDYLQDRLSPDQRTRKVMRLLFVVQILVFALDIIIITLDGAGYFLLKTYLSSFVYTLKLELDFVILNQLVEISRLGVPGLASISLASGSRMPGSNETAVVNTHLPSMLGSNEKGGLVTPQLNSEVPSPADSP
jgi:hypothetical protein